MSEHEARPAPLRVPVSDVPHRASLVSALPPAPSSSTDVNGTLQGVGAPPGGSGYTAAVVVARPVRVISDPPPAMTVEAADAERASASVSIVPPANKPAIFPPERSSGNGYAALEVAPIDPLELADEPGYSDEDDEADEAEQGLDDSDEAFVEGSDDDDGEEERTHVIEMSTPPPPPPAAAAPERFASPPEAPVPQADLQSVDADLKELEPDELLEEVRRPSGEFEEILVDTEPAAEEGPTRRSLGPPPPPPPVGRLSMPEPPDLKTLTRSARVQELRPSKPRNHAWWEVFFDDDYLRTVRTPTPEQIARQCDFIERRLRLKPGATLLDVGCGLGLPVIEMTARGFLSVGLDLSLAMLSRASEEAQSRGLRINFLHADMREMNFEGSFDAVTCLGTTLGYFDDDINRKVIERFHRALKPGGALLLDVVNRDHVIRSQPNLIWFEGDGCVCMEESEFNFFTSRLHVKRTVIIDTGKQLEHEYSLRLYSLHELGQMLHSAGFRVMEVSGRDALPGVFFGQESPNLMIVAERRAAAQEGMRPEVTGKFQIPE